MTALIHKLFAEVDKVPILVKREYLMNFTEGFGEYIKGKICSVWSYVGHQPTFAVLLEDGTYFSYLPVCALVSRPIPCSENLGPIEACPVLCPSLDFATYMNNAFTGKHLFVFNKEHVCLGKGTYFFSVEWHDENDLVHLMSVQGSLMLVPNYRMLAFDHDLSETPVLPKWKRLKMEFTENERTQKNVELRNTK